MKHARLLLAFAVLALVFFAMNRGAYRGFFDGDDLDNISWSKNLTTPAVLTALANLGATGTFRAAGQVMYVVLGKTAPLDYPRYIAWIHLEHALVVGLLFLLLRRLAFPALPAFSGTAFFALNMSAFEIYWKPMYVFDITCAVFCLLALLAWTYDRWILALLCFVLSYKAKELAIGLPFLFAVYEYTLGGRRWKRLIVPLAAAAALIVQALLWNRGPANDYSLVFTPQALARTTAFYIERLLWLPAFAGVIFMRDRRAQFGFAAFLLFMATLLVLPGRLFGAYLYVPSIGLAILIACMLTRPLFAVAFFAMWIPWGYLELRRLRVPLVEGQNDARKYTEVLSESIRIKGPRAVYVAEGAPDLMHPWGVAGLIHIFIPTAAVKTEPDPAGVLLRWDASAHYLDIRYP